MLTKSGNINSKWEQKLNDIFGTTEWRDHFYQSTGQQNIFGDSDDRAKNASFARIEAFFIQRLKSIFPHVAPKPYRMLNSVGSPMYSLCFAAGNPKGGKTALKIASHILK